MQAPDSMKKIAQRFIQDIDLIATTSEDMIIFGTKGLTTDERESAHLYLDKLLNGSQSNTELQTAWWSLPSDIAFDNGDELRQFLSHLRDSLRQ